jgi:hypothetical protein
MRCDRLRAEEHSLQVDVQGDIPVIVGHAVERSMPEGASIVDQDVVPSLGRH